MIDSIIIFIHAVIIITFRGIIFQCWIAALEVFFLPSYRKIWFQDVIGKINVPLAIIHHKIWKKFLAKNVHNLIDILLGFQDILSRV